MYFCAHVVAFEHILTCCSPGLCYSFAVIPALSITLQCYLWACQLIKLLVGPLKKKENKPFGRKSLRDFFFLFSQLKESHCQINSLRFIRNVLQKLFGLAVERKLCAPNTMMGHLVWQGMMLILGVTCKMQSSGQKERNNPELTMLRALH